MDKAIKQTEMFVEAMRDINFKELSGINDSYLETVGNFKIRIDDELTLMKECYTPC